MVRLADGHADVEGREHGEDEGLDVGHQALQQRDEDAEEDAHHADRAAHGGAEEVAHDEDDDHEAQDDDVTGRHVGEESDHQHDGLGEDTHQLDHRHQGEDLEPRRHAGGVEDVDPVVLVAAEVGDQEGDDRQDGRHGDIARDIGAGGEEGYQAQDVAEEDEEEEGQQVGQVALVVLLPYHRTHDTVAHEDHEHLHQALHPLGGLVGPFLVARAGHEDDDDQQHHGDHHGRRGLGDAEVDGLHTRGVALGVDAHDLLLLGTAAHQGIALVGGMAVVELIRHEDVQVAVVDEDDRQRDGHGMLLAVLIVIEQVP